MFWFEGCKKITHTLVTDHFEKVTTDRVTIMGNQEFFCGGIVEIMWPNKWL